jgi:hypothetical protein
MNRRFWAVAIAGLFSTTLEGCSAGYMKASELESKHQGPSDCEARCVELGMRMGAFVLVSDTLPGCVCQPKPAPSEAPKPPTSEAPTTTPMPEAPKPEAPRPDASAATDQVVIVAAAVAARALQTEQQKQQQQSSLPR